VYYTENGMSTTSTNQKEEENQVFFLPYTFIKIKKIRVELSFKKFIGCWKWGAGSGVREGNAF